MSSRLDETDHPEYKIYRKTPIRLSMLQRLRLILSEEQRRNYSKHSAHNNNKQQGSKSTGEKLAHPDYVDPQTLFVGSRNNSHANLSVEQAVATGSSNAPEDIMGERVQLDMSLNEKEVLKEIEQRLNEGNRDEKGNSSRNSPSDSYYESILENSLTEEYVRDKTTGKLVAKSDSFTNNDRLCFTLGREKSIKPILVKRPVNAPPPIPAKPLRLIKHGTNQCNDNYSTKRQMPIVKTADVRSEENGSGNHNHSSWVKAMVGRFE